MDKKRDRLDMKVSQKERQALENLAELESMTMSKWIKRAIKRAAQRKGVWPQ